MYYTEPELEALRRSLGAVGVKDRESFFFSCLSRRRRERQIFSDTPVARIFIDEAHWAEARPRHLVHTVKTRLAQQLAQTRRLERFNAREEKRAMRQLPTETDEEHKVRRSGGWVDGVLLGGCVRRSGG